MISSLLVVMIVASPSVPLPDRAALFVVDDQKKASEGSEVRWLKALHAANVPQAQGPALVLLAPVGVAEMAAGRLAFEDLDTVVAAKKFHEALDAFEKHPAATTPALMAEAHLYLGTILLQGGTANRAKALETMTRGVVLDPTLKVDAKSFAPDIKKEWERIGKDLETKSKLKLTVSSTPAGAAVAVGPKTVGVVNAATSVTVPPGRHWVSFARPGFVPSAVLVDVAKDTEVVGELTATPDSAALRAKARELAGSEHRSVPGVATELANASIARFVLVASASGRLEAFDVSGKRVLSGLSGDDDAAAAASAARIKSFMQGGEVVASAASSSASTTAAGGGSGSSADTQVAGEVEDSSGRPMSSLASMRGANTLGSGMGIRAHVGAGTSAGLASGVFGIEVAAALAVKDNFDVGVELRVPFSPYVVFAPGANMRVKLAQDGQLAFAFIGSVVVPLGVGARGPSIGLSVTPGLVASYALSEKTELLAAVLFSYNHLFYSNPVVAGTGQPGLMGTVRGGLSYSLSKAMAVYGNVEVSGGYEPLRRNIVIGNQNTGASMSATLIAGFQLRIQ